MKNRNYVLIAFLLIMSLFSTFPLFAVENTDEAPPANLSQKANKDGFSAGEVLTTPVQVFQLTPSSYSFFRVGFSLSDVIDPEKPPANTSGYVLKQKQTPEGLSDSVYVSGIESNPLFVWYVIKGNNKFKIEVEGADLRSGKNGDNAWFETATEFIPSSSNAALPSRTTRKVDGSYTKAEILNEQNKDGRLGLRTGALKLRIEATLKGITASELEGNTYKGSFTVTITTIDDNGNAVNL